MGLLAFIGAVVAGSIVMFRVFANYGLNPEDRPSERFTAMVWSGAVGCLTTIALIVVFFGLAAAFGLSSG